GGGGSRGAGRGGRGRARVWGGAAHGRGARGRDPAPGAPRGARWRGTARARGRRGTRRRRAARGGRVPRRPEPAEHPRPHRPRGRARGAPRLRPGLARRRPVAPGRAAPEPPPSRPLARQAPSRRPARRRRRAPRRPRRLHGPPPAPRPGGRVRLLIVLPGALGDVIRALPLLGRIRRARPDARLGWAVEPPSAPLLAGHPWLDRVHVFERPGGVRALLPFLQRVRRERYQVALDLGRGIKSALIAWASGASERIGFARADGREAGWLP